VTRFHPLWNHYDPSDRFADKFTVVEMKGEFIELMNFPKKCSYQHITKTNRVTIQIAISRDLFSGHLRGLMNII